MRLGNIIGLLVWLGAAPAAAFNLEIPPGPVVAPAFIVGRGGTALGIAESAGATQINPAASANRHAFNRTDWFDWDWSLDWLFLRGNDDVENNRLSGNEADIGNTLSVSLNFQFGRFGIGVSANGRNFDTCLDSDTCTTDERLSTSTASGGLNAGYSFYDGQFVLGARFNFVSFDLTQRDGTKFVDLTAFAPQAGFIWQPHELPFRVGGTFFPGSRKNLNTNQIRDLPPGLDTPEEFQAPWTAGLGVSYRLSPEPFNQPLRFEDAREPPSATNSPPYVLLAADVFLSGPTEDSIDIESWLLRQPLAIGEQASFSARVGVESEFLPYRMRARVGSYYEGSRYKSLNGRLHATAGADVRVSLFWDWRFSTAIDWAPRYFNVSLSVGLWYGANLLDPFFNDDDV